MGADANINQVATITEVPVRVVLQLCFSLQPEVMQDMALIENSRIGSVLSAIEATVLDHS